MMFGGEGTDQEGCAILFTEMTDSVSVGRIPI